MLLSHKEQVFLDHLRRQGVLRFIALDEVGRGCVAGPTVVAATSWELDPKVVSPFPGWNSVSDSKKLSEKKRELCMSLWERSIPQFALLSQIDFSLERPLQLPRLEKPKDYFVEPILTHGNHADFQAQVPSFSGVTVGLASVVEIDTFNIWRAVQLAASRALEAMPEDTLKSAVLLIDGHLPFALDARLKFLPQYLFAKADADFKTVGVSSIVAKVLRDRFMICQKDSPYDFPVHKGYGTPKHMSLIRQFGPSSMHRLSFLGKILSHS